MLGVIAQAVANIGGSDWTAPSFIEMMYPGTQDKRTAREITNDLMSRLAGG